MNAAVLAPAWLTAKIDWSQGDGSFKGFTLPPGLPGAV